MRNRVAALLAVTALSLSCAGKTGSPNAPAATAPTGEPAVGGETETGAAGGETETAVASATPEQRQIGHSLVDKYVELVRELAMTGGGDLSILVEALDEMLAEAAQHEKDGKIGAAFSRRYQRLVQVTRLVVTPDPDGSKRSAIVEEMEAFIHDVEGNERAVDPNGGLAEVAPAFVDEVLNLHMLLDGTTDRAKAREKYLKGLGD